METTENEKYYGRPVPEEFKTYHFYDDGKTSLSRHSYATVDTIISKEKAMVENKELIRLWNKCKKECSWLYSEDTDYFVKANIHFYGGPNDLWFARESDGGWYSIGNLDWWTGELDVDEKTTSVILIYSPDYLQCAERDAIKDLLKRIHNTYYEEMKKYVKE